MVDRLGPIHRVGRFNGRVWCVLITVLLLLAGDGNANIIEEMCSVVEIST